MSIKLIVERKPKEFERLVNYYCNCGWRVSEDMHVNVVDTKKYNKDTRKNEYIKAAEYSTMLVNRTGIQDDELELRYAFERNHLDYKIFDRDSLVALIDMYMNDGYCTIITNGKEYTFGHPLRCQKDSVMDTDDECGYIENAEYLARLKEDVEDEVEFDEFDDVDDWDY